MEQKKTELCIESLELKNTWTCDEESLLVKMKSKLCIED